MYGSNEPSGETILEITKRKGLLKDVIKLCDTTWFEGLEEKMHRENQWTYNGMLRDFGLKIENKEKRSLKAGSLMYENAKKMNLMESLEKLIKETKSLGIKKGYDNASVWTVDGLLQSLGNEIEYIEEQKFPELRDDSYY